MELQNVLKDDTGDFTSTIRPSSSLVFIIAAFSIPINNLSPSTGLSVCIKLDIFFNFSILFFKFFFFFNCFFGREEGRGRNIDWLPSASPLRGIKPTSICPRTGNQTGHLLVHGTMPSQLSYTASYTISVDKNSTACFTLYFPFYIHGQLHHHGYQALRNCSPQCVWLALDNQ